MKPVVDNIQNYQRKWDMWIEWIQEESQNKCFIISQEIKHQLDVHWKDGENVRL